MIRAAGMASGCMKQSGRTVFIPDTAVMRRRHTDWERKRKTFFLTKLTTISIMTNEIKQPGEGRGWSERKKSSMPRWNWHP